jgi:hypothetical protein
MAIPIQLELRGNGNPAAAGAGKAPFGNAACTSFRLSGVYRHATRRNLIGIAEKLIKIGKDSPS